LAGYAAQPENITMAINGNTPGRSVTNSAKTADFLGYKAGLMGSDDLSALTNTNPAHPWYWHVYQLSGDESTTLLTTALVTIDYDIIFFDKIDGALDLKERMLLLKKPKEPEKPEPKDTSKDQKDDFIHVPKSLIKEASLRSLLKGS
jgi:hypothetical protein